MLVDTFGRVASALRVSLIDRCNLRCSYCMPPEGVEWLPRSAILTDDEVVRLVRLGVERLGITKVRYTGGEPLLRRNLAGIMRRTSALSPRPEISITTNAIGLARSADELRAAGLDRVNVSLDTLDRANFTRITRRDRLADVLDGAAAAHRETRAVKINMVMMRGVNDHEAVPMLRYCVDRGYELRLIEPMPLDAQHRWRRDDLVSSAEILEQLQGSFTLVPDESCARGSATAETFVVDGGPTRVGVIGSVTRPFCGTCDRVRLTAEGKVLNCLFAREDSDLGAALRAGADDEELARRWRAAVHGKHAGHGMNDPGFLRPARPISAIGG